MQNVFVGTIPVIRIQCYENGTFPLFGTVAKKDCCANMLRHACKTITLPFSRCSEMFSDDPRPRCSRCSQMAYVTRCSQMLPDGPRCCQMLPDATRWSQRVPDVPTCSQMLTGIRYGCRYSWVGFGFVEQMIEYHGFSLKSQACQSNYMFCFSSKSGIVF